jgi:hypothetical protein
MGGEGNEYSWAGAKNKPRKVPIGANQSVNSCSESICYNRACTCLLPMCKSAATQESGITAHFMEKMMKKFKTH